MCYCQQEPQCQTLPPPSVAGLQHCGVVRLVQLRVSRRSEPLLPPGVGESPPVGQQQGGRRCAPRAAAAQGHVGPRGRARRQRTSRQRRVPAAAFCGQEATPPPSPPQR